jgi:hypothetical protein
MILKVMHNLKREAISVSIKNALRKASRNVPGNIHGMRTIYEGQALSPIYLKATSCYNFQYSFLSNKTESIISVDNQFNCVLTLQICYLRRNVTKKWPSALLLKEMIMIFPLTHQ